MVITIVVLLILAGVTIALVLGKNGIIERAKQAKEKTTESITAEQEGMNSLIQEMEEIIGGEGNKVEIIVSKTPETEKSGGVRLLVEKVKGIKENIDINNINTTNLNEVEKKELIKILYVKGINQIEGRNYKTFTEAIEKELNGNEEAFWTNINNMGGTDLALTGVIQDFKNAGIKTVDAYTVTNQDGNISKSQIALKNGKYTFTITEIATGKIYTKTVDVTNIDTSMEYYYVKEFSSRSPKFTAVTLLNRTTPTTFDNLYIKYNGKRIEITNYIETSPTGGTWIETMKIGRFLSEIGEISDRDTMIGTIQEIEIVKDGKSYFENINFMWLGAT